MRKKREGTTRKEKREKDRRGEERIVASKFPGR